MVVADGRYYDSLEIMSPDERQKYQLQNLSETLEHAYQHSRMAKNIMDFNNIKPSQILTFEDLELFPITRKIDLIEIQKANPPFGGLLSIPAEDIERIFISPGPIYEYQPSGIQWFARSFYAAGFRKGDIVVNTFTYHMSPAGILFHEGLRQCGATVVVMGTGNTDALIKGMLDIKVTGFVGTPSFLLSVLKRAEDMGYNIKRDFALNKAWFTGEMLPPSLRRVFESEYGLSTSQAYAVTEPGGAIAYECSEKNGLHLMDEYVVEIVDPQTGRQIGPGEVGEIVVTPVHNRSWGLIRFGTGDMSSLITTPCPCGRTSLRIKGILGRTGDAVKVRGMFIVAKQAEEVMKSFAEISRFQIVVRREDDRDEMVLNISLKEQNSDSRQLIADIGKKFQDSCRLKLDNINIVEDGDIAESRRMIEDLRTWE